MLMLLRALGCPPRHAWQCRPGTSVGVRRAGPKPPPLNAPATRRAVAAFAGVARDLAASAEARAAFDLQHATARAKRRAACTQTRMMASAARELSHLTAVFENAAAARHALAAGPKRKAAQERALLKPEARMRAMHDAARPTQVAAAVTPPCDPGDRRIDAIAERHYAKRGRGPRIRGL